MTGRSSVAELLFDSHSTCRPFAVLTSCLSHQQMDESLPVARTLITPNDFSVSSNKKESKDKLFCVCTVANSYQFMLGHPYVHSSELTGTKCTFTHFDGIKIHHVCLSGKSSKQLTNKTCNFCSRFAIIICIVSMSCSVNKL